MSDVHVKYLLSRVEMSGSAIAVRGEEGPRRWQLSDETRSQRCLYCGGPLLIACGRGECRVRAIEMRKAKR